MGFRGSGCHTVDEKGRVAIPARFREDLRAADDDRVVVTRNLVRDARCLDVYPLAGWLSFEARVAEKERFDPTVSRFRRFYFSEAQDASVDKQGRILISPRLRQFASLDRDALFVSDLDKFQIWDPTVWSRVAEMDEQEFIDNPQNMRLGI